MLEAALFRVHLLVPTVCMTRLLSLQRDSTKSFNISEFLQALPGKDHSVIWRALEAVTERCLQEMMVEQGSGVNGKAPPPSEKQVHSVQCGIVEHGLVLDCD